MDTLLLDVVVLFDLFAHPLEACGLPHDSVVVVIGDYFDHLAEEKFELPLPLARDLSLLGCFRVGSGLRVGVSRVLILEKRMLATG